MPKNNNNDKNNNHHHFFPKEALSSSFQKKKIIIHIIFVVAAYRLLLSCEIDLRRFNCYYFWQCQVLLFQFGEKLFRCANNGRCCGCDSGSYWFNALMMAGVAARCEVHGQLSCFTPSSCRKFFIHNISL